MSKLYQIRHVTRYRYESEITESVMEVRKCPLSKDLQRLMSFKLEVKPGAKLFRYEEPLGNVVHHFDIRVPHQEMTVTAESLVEVRAGDEIPPSLPTENWQSLHRLESDTQYLDFIMHSPLIPPTDALRALYDQVAPREEEDPLTFLRRLSHFMVSEFAYVPQSTQVDSSIDQALESRQGVCQDFAHIMVGLSRLAGIPSRYVSGYLFHRKDCGDRSSQEASHAWMEAYLPDLGWVGFDPTNNILAGERHIVTNLGRDYRDVTPTRGVFLGGCASELSVAVQVHPADAPHTDDQFKRMDESEFRSEPEPEPEPVYAHSQQAQQ